MTHNTRAISGIPARIQYERSSGGTGEAFIRPSDFEQLKTTLVDGDGKPYKNGRNLAAGSVRLFDAGACLGTAPDVHAVQCAGGYGGSAPQIGAPQGAAAAGLFTLQVHGHQASADAGRKPRKASGSSSSMRQTPTFPSTVSLSPTTTSRCQKAAGAPAITTRTALLSNLRMTCSRQNSRRLNGRLAAPARLPRFAIFEPVEIDGCEVSRAEPAQPVLLSRIWNWRRAAVSW